MTTDSNQLLIICNLAGISNETPDSLQQPEETDITTTEVARLLRGINAWQRANARPLGCLNTNRIRLKDNQLVIALGGEQIPYPSVMKDDDEARFFAKVDRDAPEPVDDLIALGVALAEHTIPPNKRPEISTDKKAYRETLAKKLRVNFADLIVQRDHVSRNKLIRTLLRADQTRTQPQNFLKTHGPLLAHDHDGTLRTASVVDNLRNKTLLAVMTGLTLCLVAYFLFEKRRLQKTAKADTEHLRADLKTLKEEKAALQKEKTDLQEDKTALQVQNADLRTTSKTPGKSPPTEKKLLALETLTKHPAYRTFMSDINLKNDQRFQKLLRNSKITVGDYSYAEEKLKTLQGASKLWWDFVRENASYTDIERRLKGQPTDVQEAVHQWLAEVVQKRTYRISIDKVIAQQNWKNYPTAVGLTGNSDDVVTPTFNSNVQKPQCTFNFKWKAGDTLEVTPEHNTYRTINPINWIAWEDFSERNYSGYLSLHKLLIDGFGDESNIKMDLAIPNLPGPPRDSGQTFSFPDFSKVLTDEQDLRPDSQKPVDSSATPQSESIGDLRDGLAF